MTASERAALTALADRCEADSRTFATCEAEMNAKGYHGTNFAGSQAALASVARELRAMLSSPPPAEPSSDREALRQICHALGVCYCWDYGCEPGPLDEVLARIRDLTSREGERIDAEVAAAPPASDERPSEERPHRVHTLKTWPAYFAEVRAGRKRFELRKNDRGYGVGDCLVLQEWDPATERYTGEMVSVRVAYMVQGEWGLPADACVMSIEPWAAAPATDEGRGGREVLRRPDGSTYIIDWREVARTLAEHHDGKFVHSGVLALALDAARAPSPSPREPARGPRRRDARCQYVHRRDPERMKNSHPCGARMSFDSLDSDNPLEVTCPRCQKQLDRAAPSPRSDVPGGSPRVEQGRGAAGASERERGAVPVRAHNAKREGRR